MRITVLFSGGLDSLACLLWAIEKYGKNNVKVLFVNYRQPYADAEYRAVVEITSHLCISFEYQTLQLPFSIDKNNGHVPLRNTWLLMLAALNEESEGVVLGMLRGESCEDKNPKYIALMQKFFDSQFQASIYRPTTRKFVVHTPFEQMTKTQVVAWLREHSADYLISQSVACFNGTRCGKCISCLNRWVALTNNDMHGEIWEHNPFLTLMDMLDTMGDARKKNPYLFYFKQVWLKRRWLSDSFRACSKYCQRTYGMSFLKCMRKKVDFYA
jgi:7-cyano-7-deazaguanine synthase in queuosine biosynthesis